MSFIFCLKQYNVIYVVQPVISTLKYYSCLDKGKYVKLAFDIEKFVERCNIKKNNTYIKSIINCLFLTNI